MCQLELEDMTVQRGTRYVGNGCLTKRFVIDPKLNNVDL
jgi:hypothetical protein